MPRERSMSHEIACPACGYSLHGLPAQHTCPECGLGYEPGMAVYRQKRLESTAGLALGASLLIAGAAMLVWKGDPLLVTVGAIWTPLHLWRLRRKPNVAIVYCDSLCLIGHRGERTVVEFAGLVRAKWSFVDGSIALLDNLDFPVHVIPRGFLRSDRRARQLARAIHDRVATGG